MIQELYINNQLVDLSPGNRVILNRDFIDLQNPDARISDASLRVKLPKSKRNNIIFGHINVENVKDKFVRIEDFDATYIVDGVIVHDGTFRILSVDEDSYTGVLLSGVASWSQLLTGKSLRDLKNDDLVTPWSAPFTGLISNSSQYSLGYYINNQSFINHDICFPLISYGTFFSNFIVNNNIDEIHGDTLSIDNFPPAVYDLKIIKRIFQNIGWSVDSSLFSDTEAQKVYLPYTTSDKFEWNYGTLLDADASGGTFSYINNYNNPYLGNFLFPITFQGGITNQKSGDFNFLRFPSFYNNTQDNFKGYSILGSNGVVLTEGYLTKLTTNYSFDFEIKNWFFDIFGECQLYYYSAPSGVSYCPETPFSNLLGAPGYGGLGELKAGFMLYIDTPEDTYLPEILENLNQYIFNFYYDATSTIEINHPNILAAYVPTTSGVTNSYFFPYDPDANIVITGNANLVQFTPFSTAAPTPNPNQIVVRPYSWKWSGNTKFEFRDIKIPFGFVIKAMVFGSGTDLTSRRLINAPCPVVTTSVGISLFKECQYNFSSSTINFNFLANSSNDDVDLNISKNLPEIGQLDYIKSWINRYNLFINTDYKNKKVTFEPYDNYFLPNDFYYDLSGKFNDNFFEPKSEPVVLPKIIQFYYSNDTSDALVGKDLGYGSVKIQNDNVYCENSKDITNLFSSTKMREFKYRLGSGSTSLKKLNLPSICDIDRYSFSDLSQIDLNYTNTPRLLKLTGQFAKDDNGNNIIVKVQDKNLPVLTSTFEENDPNKISLSYYGDYGLYNKYFERYLNEISDSYIITLDCKITPTDFENLKPNTPVLINGQIYIINKIRNYDPLSNGKTTISFIRKYTN